MGNKTKNEIYTLIIIAKVHVITMMTDFTVLLFGGGSIELAYCADVFSSLADSGSGDVLS
jgi:hypothetical protein